MFDNTIAGRIRAAFLCLFVTLSLALAALVYLLSPVTIEANAQSMCVPGDRFAAILAEQPTVTGVIMFDNEQAATYLMVTTGIEIVENAGFIVFIRDAGDVGIVPVINGMACPEYGVIELDGAAHQRGMAATYGDPI